jgi:hypothetical protein
MMDDPASGWHFDIRYGQGRREIWEDARLLKPNCVMSGSITVSAVLLGKDASIHTRGARGHGHMCAHAAGAWRRMFPLM